MTLDNRYSEGPEIGTPPLTHRHTSECQHTCDHRVERGDNYCGFCGVAMDWDGYEMVPTAPTCTCGATP